MKRPGGTQSSQKRRAFRWMAEMAREGVVVGRALTVLCACLCGEISSNDRPGSAPRIFARVRNCSTVLACAWIVNLVLIDTELRVEIIKELKGEIKGYWCC